MAGATFGRLAGACLASAGPGALMYNRGALSGAPTSRSLVPTDFNQAGNRAGLLRFQYPTVNGAGGYSGNRQLVGVTKDGGGNLASRWVTVQPQGVPIILRAMVSDAAGNFAFYGLAPGNYLLLSYQTNLPATEQSAIASFVAAVLM